MCPKDQESRGSASAAPKGRLRAEPEASEPLAEPAAATREPEIWQWVCQAREGDEAAFENLVNQFQDQMYRRAMYILRNADDALDVIQEAFIRCYRNLHQFRGEAKFSTWLYQIVNNTALNYSAWHQRRGKGKTYSLDAPIKDDDGGEYTWEHADPAPGPRREAQGREALSALQEGMEKLTHEHREILLLRFDTGLSYEEIAERLTIKVGTVKSRINRARQELRTNMGEHLDF